MPKRKRRNFSPEFKADAVRLCQVGDRSIEKVTKDLDLTESALRGWIKQAEVVATKSPPDALSSKERDELMQLRRDNKRLLMEREILKKAAAFFAKENA